MNTDSSLPVENELVSNITNKSPPTYRLAHYSVVTSVETVWKEWYQGWDGRPSIKHLIDTYGSAWRDPKDKKMFSRRKKIIDVLNQLIETRGELPENAIQYLEAKRNKMAISTFADLIAKSSLNIDECVEKRRRRQRQLR